MGSWAIFEIRDYRTMAPIVAFSWPVWVRILIILGIPILISCYKLSGYSNIDGFPALFLFLILISIVLEAPFNNLDIWSFVGWSRLPNCCIIYWHSSAVLLLPLGQEG